MQPNDFRPIYYLGCKKSFTPAIKAAIDEVDPGGGRLLDLFSGTCAVGSSLALTREVTAVDVQEYSRVICSAMLRPAKLPLTKIECIKNAILADETVKTLFWCVQPLIEHENNSINTAVLGGSKELVEFLVAPPVAGFDSNIYSKSNTKLGDVIQAVVDRLKSTGLWNSPNSTVTRYFGGIYFSFQQAIMLDAILIAADHSEENSKDTLKAAALSTASQIVNTVGKQFAQPIQPLNKAGALKTNIVDKVQQDRSANALEVFCHWLDKYAKLPLAIGKPQAFRQDYLEAIKQHASGCSVIYADPPYTRDHYSRFYHVLETMCLRDNPQISCVVKDGGLVLSRGAYREGRHQSPFCIKSAALGAFEALFKEANDRNLPLVLSYSPHSSGDGTHPRVVSVDQIIELAHCYYTHTELSVVEGVTHNQLNRRGLKLKTREHAEILLKCFC